jgi:hypothetical protein
VVEACRATDADQTRRTPPQAYQRHRRSPGLPGRGVLIHSINKNAGASGFVGRRALPRFTQQTASTRQPNAAIFTGQHNVLTHITKSAFLIFQFVDHAEMVVDFRMVSPKPPDKSAEPVRTSLVRQTESVSNDARQRKCFAQRVRTAAIPVKANQHPASTSDEANRA